MPDVKCTVANCLYWKSGNNCNADAIMIEIDQHADSEFSTEFSGESFLEHQDKASEASNTCCHTFIAR